MVKVVLDTMISPAEEGKTLIVVTCEFDFARSVAAHFNFKSQREIIKASYPNDLINMPKNERTRTFLGGILRSH